MNFQSTDTHVKKETLNSTNTKAISLAQDILGLIESVKVNKINIISRNEEAGDFNIYTNDHLLQELNFIDKYLGLKVTSSDKQDTENVELVKTKVKRLTRACGLRYKVRDLLLGVR